MGNNDKTGYSIVISSCDKFSDLWKNNLDLLKKHWLGILPPIYLITDRPNDFQYEGVNLMWFDGDMPSRIKQALFLIHFDYVLLTLDDYFLIKNTESNKISNLVRYCQKESVNYLCLYTRRRAKGFNYKAENKIIKANLNKNYAVDLYPAIWEKDFLNYCIKEDTTPWEFEPKLTVFAKEYRADCRVDLSGPFVILDVVRKGKILHSAYKYSKKHGIDLGNRPLISRSFEAKLKIMDFVTRHAPKWVYVFLKKVGRAFGMKFYSDAIDNNSKA